MNRLKEKTISAALEMSGRIYIHASPHEELFIGKRGLIGQEEKNGIVLLISESSCRNLEIGQSGISAELRFAGIWENVFIPYESIDAVLDDIGKPSFIFNYPLAKGASASSAEKAPEKEKKLAEVVTLDFKNPKKKS